MNAPDRPAPSRHRPPAVVTPAACAALLLLAGCAALKPTAPAPAAAPPPGAAPAAAASGLPPAPPVVLPRPATAAVAAPTPAPPPPGAGAAAAPPAPAAAPPGTPPAFATVVRDARRIEGGVITAWQKDDKVWLELAPGDFGRLMLLSPKLRTGIGEQLLFGGLMAYPMNGAGGTKLVEFTRVHNTVRLMARNVSMTARAGTPEGRAVEAAYSPSLLGSATVASQPHPERKSVLVEVQGMFLSDMLGVGMQLQRAFRQGYSLDARNSVITAVRAAPDTLVIETEHHYYAGSLAVPASGGMTGSPAPSLPSYLPDARSLFVGQHFSLMALPAQPMAPRPGDPRVGLFTSTVFDFSDDLQRTPRQRIVNRWRLEKKDPAAELSEPVKPITFWIDRNVPLAYRPTVREAILEWNKAFERIGFRDAIVVKQQPDDAAFDTLDAGVPSVRWMMNASPSFGAIGPRHVDPRSGEILDADVAIEGLQTRIQRALRVQALGGVALNGFARTLGGLAEEAGLPAAPGAHALHDGHEACLHADFAAEQAAYGLDVLAARGELDPESPQAQQFVLDYVKDVTLHEIGHVLGLRHNFRASRAYTEAQLADPEFTRTRGTTGSVMEYQPINLPRPGMQGGALFQTTLGPYDYWAIEYAYRPAPPADGGDAQAARRAEREMLLSIAGRSADPLLAYGTDEDSFVGLDPETLQFDLGADPIAFAAKRLEIAADLFRRQETRELRPDQDYSVLRRSIAFALGDVGSATGVLTRQIGGVRTLRDFPGTGRDPLQPVSADVQRAALALIDRHVLSAEGLSLSPALQRRLVPDYLDRAEVGLLTDFALPQRLLELQRGVLALLMSEAVAARILDSASKLDTPAQAFQLSELYEQLGRAVWSDLDRRAPIAPPRRDLQREHVNRVVASLLRPGPQARADARGLMRQQAQVLLVRVDARLAKPAGLDPDSRAHLQDTADSLRQALRAPLLRSAAG